MSSRSFTVAFALTAFAGCAAGNGLQLSPTAPFHSAVALKQGARRPGTGGALGPVLTTVDGGALTGWDIDENSDYGLLSAGYKNGTRLEAFDLRTAKVTTLGSFQRGSQGSIQRQFVVLKILSNRGALVDDVKFNPTTFARDDSYPTVKPANDAKVTGEWTPRHRHYLQVQWVADNQNTTTNALFSDVRTVGHKRLGLGVIISNIAGNAFGPTDRFQTNRVFQVPNLVAQDTGANLAIVPMQLFTGSIFNPFESPSFEVYDLSTKKHSVFSPNVGSGQAMGIAIDSATHTMCTTTADDSNVEFYDLKKQTGFTVALPGGSGEGTGGGAVAVDQLHHLFIVTQPAGALASASVYVYDEQGNLQESIGGFNFSNLFSAVFAYVAVNPKLRVGYASTANADQLQSFTY